ncbi:protein MALE DISCOVERER 2 [Selaginella moellendorffii]|uniref:protein MALE DISCOVERER 2 n=1 Tax=Selaginella moellendorffii TaxID=88036 RepID=UPI000D1C74E3|nr:protein MALE DISCOVERER 2 [Selaginella moellendorffii]|eukprot:XP_024526900.1 protein MALE DISCOVERER 2 [Selaginella moellendorffii]
MVRVMRIWDGAWIMLSTLVFVLVSSLYGGFCLTSANQASALSAFRQSISSDPRGALSGWSADHGSLCQWRGVTCSSDGRVIKLELVNLSLQGKISPELSRLEFLKKIDLRGNELSESIPKELWVLKRLFHLDLSGNNLSGTIPPNVGNLVNLRTLNLGKNHFQGSLPTQFGKLVRLRHLRLDHNHFTGFIPGRAFCNLKSLQTLDVSENSFVTECFPSATVGDCLHLSERLISKHICERPHRFLQSRLKNNATRVNGVHSSHDHHVKLRHYSHHHKGFQTLAVLLSVFSAVVFVFLMVGVFLYKRKTVAVSPWKAGMSGHLQKVFVTDVPSLTWAELQAACEDFSNIIGSSPDTVVFKGTLSNGTEVAVTSIRISAASWTASSEIFFRRKIEALARMKHTHLVNLLGYCAEEEPFARMLLFEYVPNGTLSEHLHNVDSDHLDWTTRMRIVMGAAYGLEYMHHELVPPASHSNFDSFAIYLTEDYAAKLADFGISKLAVIKSDRRKSFSNSIGYDDFEGSDRHAPDFESNVLSFGMFLLEVVTGRLPYSEKEGSLMEWALEFLSSPETLGYIVDSSLKSFDLKQLLVVCDVIRLCIHPDSSKRPTMKTVASILSKGLNISPEAAQPKCSPLLWAELEILSN